MQCCNQCFCWHVGLPFHPSPYLIQGRRAFVGLCCEELWRAAHLACSAGSFCCLASGGACSLRALVGCLAGLGGFCCFYKALYANPYFCQLLPSAVDWT